jgi:hypothetical protein
MMVRRPSLVEVEILYFDGCPSWEHVARSLAQLADEGMPILIRTVAVASLEEAELLRFPGSPTLRVGGRDLFPGPETGRPAIGCRVYPTPEGIRGWPAKAQIAEAIRQLG